jgi:pimeloyl-ACP methyl ester carboxylesterase
MQTGTVPGAGTRTAQLRAATRTLAGLAADDYGHADDRTPLVLLHGLTFDRSMWRPALTELHRIDPGRRALALDLPGHGASPGWRSYDIQGLARGIHHAVQEAGLEAPIVVGHSIAAVIATAYAAEYPARGIINVDQSLQIAPFAGLLQSVASKLRGPEFPAVWQMFAASMHTDLLPASAQELVRSSSQPRQDLVLAYWREVLDQPARELAAVAAGLLDAVRFAGVPYHVVVGADLEPEYQAWLSKTLPQATVTTWPGSGHFPHLAHPDRFAQCLAATASPSGWTLDSMQPG